MELVNWMVDHWVEIGAAVALIMGGARLLLMAAAAIAKLTPSPEDDEVVGRVQKAFDWLVGVLKMLALHIKDTAKGNGTSVLLFVLLLGTVLSAGCVAPAAVRDAAAWEEVGLQNHIANDQRMLDAFITVYRLAREADIEFTTTMAIENLKAQCPETDPEVFAAKLRVIIDGRDKARAGTETVVTKMREMAAVNQNELAKALRIHGKMVEWMQAGIDESAVPSIAAEVIGLVQSFKKKE